MQLDIIPHPICKLGECPIWYDRWKEFIFTDIFTGKIYACEPKSKNIRLLLETGLQTGALLVADDGCLVIFSERGILRAVPEGNKFILDLRILWSPMMYADERFNDAICDSKGRMIVGTKRDCNKDGRLLVFEAGKEPKCLLEGLIISNGMAFSTDGKTLYHTDSIPALIKAYDYEPETSTLSNPRTVLDLGGSGVEPDGLTMDSEGKLWSVLWNGKRIVQFDANGNILSEYPLPYPQCSSLSFGGEAYKTLFITSASFGSTNECSPLGGTCMLAQTDVSGKADWKARLD